ncbi:MAG: transglycosylase SLT domain-containing protein [Reinekea sp.]|jgi:membrane-bound lytic murein transglycosylase MltF
MKHLIILVILLTTLAFSTSEAADFSKYKQHTRYDNHFRKYSKRFFGAAFDWHYFKAQAVAESNLNPEAQSHVGAQGVMQIMPRTFDEIKNKSKLIGGSATEPRWNIAAGIWYNKQQFDFWQKGRTLEERLKFMYGSYNAGRGNLLKAQRQAINAGLSPRHWVSIAQVLSKVTGQRSQETIDYVEKIFTIKEDIK